jgi:hypothetical protein
VCAIGEHFAQPASLSRFCCAELPRVGDCEKEETLEHDDATVPEEVVAALQDCEHQVDQLQRENKLLRDASRTFGALAERLNASLTLERRQNTDRRARPRSTEDRRQPESVGPSTRR